MFLLVASSILFSSPFCVTQMDCPVGPQKGGWGYLMSPTCLESQGCYLIPLSYFHSFPFLGVFFIFLVPSLVTLSLVIFLLPENAQIFLSKRLALLYGACLGVGLWYVQLAAIWHWYLPLCIYISPPPPPPPPSLFIFFFNQVLILNQTDWSTISECPSFVCFFYFIFRAYWRD